ncbi:putative inactive receptor kinase [Acorus calamus]|uniref:Inactive receptor kinase n=1 Tax=Acorus calamus TaxID=4465 RepID=A0AAV9E0Z0_ACOCL|nr:putative inactive receptor kinase [Acorus calamus]
MPQHNHHHHQDLSSLLAFKASADPLGSALPTWSGPNPCSGPWLGLKCDQFDRVTNINLDGSSLTGPIAPLLQLKHLKLLSLQRNSLSGRLPPLSNLSNPSLRILSLSHNVLDGPINVSLPNLLVLRLDRNRFSGGLDSVRLDRVLDFNVSENRLSGAILGRLTGFPPSSFFGNLALCGSPLPSCLSSSVNDSASTSTTCIKTLAKLGVTSVLYIVAIDAMVITLVLAVILVVYACVKRRMKRKAMSRYSMMSKNRSEERDQEVGGGLTAFEGGENLRIDCLLKASAEVLGKGTMGITYKAIIDEGGLAVAVKRLTTSRYSNGKAFDRCVRLIGRVRHEHIVSLRACYRNDGERLLVYDYMPNGSLQTLLHNNGYAMDWMRRKEILMGVAEGLEHIHANPSREPHVHGNIKPSNILIDGQGNARVSDWGLTLIAHNGFDDGERELARVQGAGARERAEEGDEGDGCVVTEKAAGGMGREAEAMAMVKIGMMCTKEAAGERPTMRQVVGMMSEVLEFAGEAA